MFDYVNIVAVLGTTFFMMAAATLWYSEYLFLKPWLSSTGLTEADLERASPHMMRNSLLTFLSYVVMVYLIARVIGYAEVFALPVREVSLMMVLGVSAFLVGFVVWEQRSLVYYAITAGFSAVFILGSAFFLYHWPW